MRRRALIKFTDEQMDIIRPLVSDLELGGAILGQVFIDGVNCAMISFEEAAGLADRLQELGISRNGPSYNNMAPFQNSAVAAHDICVRNDMQREKEASDGRSGAPEG